jgi:hypothetical protein
MMDSGVSGLQRRERRSSAQCTDRASEGVRAEPPTHEGSCSGSGPAVGAIGVFQFLTFFILTMSFELFVLIRAGANHIRPAPPIQHGPRARRTAADLMPRQTLL